MEEDVVYDADDALDSVVTIAEEMVDSAISEEYDRELAKEALDYSVGDLAQAASYLLDRGMSEAELARFAEAALADIELVDDPRYGEYIRPSIVLRPTPDSPAEETDPIIDVAQDGLPISPVPVFAYDFELAKQALDAGGGDLGRAAEFLMGRGLSAADLEMFAAQALADEALLNDATYGAFLAPPPMAPIGSDAFGNPLPGNPAYGSMPGIPPADEIESYYDSRFASEEEAIAYAEANGQGALTVAADGTITNQNGEVMVYDSDGNLAPAAIGNLGLNGDPGNPNPMPVFAYDFELAKQALDAGGGDLGRAAEFLMGRGLSAADLEMFAAQALADEALLNDATYGAFLAPPPMAPIGSDAFGNPLPGNPSDDRAALYDSRFGTEEDAIDYAEANGQGPLTTLADGSLINQYGEVMVYDSSGNLAPAPRAIPVGMIVGEDGQFVDDPNWSPEQAVADAMANAEIAAQINAQGGFAYDFELAKQALDAGGGDLGRAAEFLMGRGLSAADLEMFAAQALADEALLNDATYGAFLAPPPMAPIGSDAFGNPLPGNPAYGSMPGIPPADEIESYYDSRFASEEEAIAYAEANGQGALTVAADGTITNQNGEVMVYDSDGNLAPAAIGNLGLNGDPGNPNPMPVFAYDFELAKQALDAGGGDLGRAAEFLMGRGLSAADLEMFAAQALADEALLNDATYGAFLAPPPMAPIGSDAFGNPLPGNPSDDRAALYDSRFGTEEDAIDYAEANGQGPLTTLADGSLINQYGEVMVYDSSGNLAPAPRAIPVGMIVGEDGQFVDDPNWSPEQAVADAMANAEIAAQINAQGGFAYDFELAKQALDAGGGDLGRAAEFLMGRGLSAADLEMFAAQALADEALLNDATYGAFLAPPPMAPIGSDAFGNPLPGNPAYGSMPGIPPADEIESYYDSRFASEEEAIAYAEANGQGALTVAADGTITNQNGEVMVYDSDGNLAPAAIGNLGLNGDPGNPNPMPVYGDPSNPNQGVDPTDRDQVFDSRFGTEEDAIVYAEASGQGPLTTLADGSLINQYGETMVYDSSGNLAPAPRDVPVGMVEGENGQFVDDSDWTAEQAVAEAAANAEIAAQVDAQAAADAAAAQAAADAAAAQAAADAAAAQAAADAAAELESDSSSEGSVTNPRLIADVAYDLDVVGVSLFDFAGI